VAPDPSIDWSLHHRIAVSDSGPRCPGRLNSSYRSGSGPHAGHCRQTEPLAPAFWAASEWERQAHRLRFVRVEPMDAIEALLGSLEAQTVLVGSATRPLRTVEMSGVDML